MILLIKIAYSNKLSSCDLLAINFLFKLKGWVDIPICPQRRAGTDICILNQLKRKILRDLMSWMPHPRDSKCSSGPTQIIVRKGTADYKSHWVCNFWIFRVLVSAQVLSESISFAGIFMQVERCSCSLHYRGYFCIYVGFRQLQLILYTTLNWCGTIYLYAQVYAMPATFVAPNYSFPLLRTWFASRPITPSRCDLISDRHCSRPNVRICIQ